MRLLHGYYDPRPLAQTNFVHHYLGNAVNQDC